MLDLDAYLHRIGLRGRPTLAEVHRAHATTIPFENLDPHRGTPPSLEPADLEDKLVRRRRGGYCFEQNLLLAEALRALGHEVEPILGRVGPRGTERPRTHLLLRVTAEGAVWHADVGFGRGTLREPIPFGGSEEHVQDGWRFRLVADGGELILQSLTADEWSDGYSFVPEPVPHIDIETSNWYTAAHPRSAFVRGLIVARYAPDATALSLSDWSGRLVMTEASPSGERRVTPVAWAEAGGVLADRFGLPGWTFDEQGRPHAAAAQ